MIEVFYPKRFPVTLVRFTEFALDHLRMRNLKDRTIIIKYVKNIEDDLFGMAYGDKELCEIYIARKTIDEPITMRDRMGTIAHELVHARQYFNGNLSEKNGITIWKKQQYYEYDYTCAPWEVEALQIETQVMEIYDNFGSAFRYK